jgi:serine O-acetyltransferase
LLGPSIVVGEMTVLGDDCTVHARVTLTAGSLTPYQLLRDDREPPPGRGHPTIGNHCELETGVIVQGDVFVGNDTRLMCGAIITRDVPNGATALGPVVRILQAGNVLTDLDARALQAIAQRLQALEEQVQILNFSARRQLGGPRETHNPATYGPSPAVEKLLEGAGLD